MTKTAMSPDTIHRVGSLRLVIVRLARRIRQHSAAGLTPSQLSALSTIERHGAMRLNRLAERERISKSSVTRLVSKLERNGYVEVLQDPDDGRCSNVALSGLGQRLVSASNRRGDAYLARQVAALSDDERQVLLDAVPILERLLGIKA